MAPAAGMWMVHFNPPHSKILAEVNGLIVGHNSVCLLIKERQVIRVGRRQVPNRIGGLEAMIRS